MTVTHYDLKKRLKDEPDPRETWEDEFDTGCRCLEDAPEGLTPWDYAQLVVDYFNDTLKPGEIRRELVGVEKVK